MVKPYVEGSTWSFRLRRNGEQIYKSGFKTQSEANKALRQLEAQIEGLGKAVGIGPQRTSLAQALSDWAMETLAYRKGAPQEARRINRYLRAAGLPVLKLREIKASTDDIKARQRKDEGNRAVHHHIELSREPIKDGVALRKIPASLQTHRATLDKQAQSTEKCASS